MSEGIKNIQKTIYIQDKYNTISSQDKTSQDKTKQDKTRLDKTRPDERRQN